MFARFLFLAFGLFLTMASLKAGAAEVSGPARVIDGDTLVVGETIIRLHGIDAAETGQRCAGDGHKILRPGKDAVLLLQGLAESGVSCAGTEWDDYGRLVAVCRSAKGEDINRQLVADGWAWAFVKYSSVYVQEEASARSQHLGVWAMACEPPWAFRSKRWEVAVQKAPEGCPIKGNISENGRIYHVPWSRDYIKTRVDTARGERWFCSEKDALAAGWRPPHY
jgi:endonuclease YncB( thermonuclease family)